MSEKDVRILVVDDEIAIRQVLAASLKDEGYHVETAFDGSVALQKMKEFRPQIVLLDIWMPGHLDGIEVLKRGKSQYPHVDFIMMSGHGTIETAVKATKLGAWDFIEKPLSMDKISILIGNILNYQLEREEKQILLTRLRESIALIGSSPRMVKLKQLIARVAPTHSWVLIYGENGTGKELVAQNIHYLSSRASKPFLAINCAALPSELVESELFGYEKGAFTGAEKRRRGKFEQAHEGTLFLDEVADMSLETQAKLLRVLQEKKIYRLGGEKAIDVDVRVIAATNKDLKKEISEGRFREDLFHRLNVIPLEVPSLSERKEDIPMLVEHFSRTFSTQSGVKKKVFSEKAIKKLQLYK
ncbi:MAG: sigma-54-dependent Fis family transcriptional regulator, partial [Bdellovibrio sp.]